MSAWLLEHGIISSLRAPAAIFVLSRNARDHDLVGCESTDHGDEDHGGEDHGNEKAVAQVSQISAWWEDKWTYWSCTKVLAEGVA